MKKIFLLFLIIVFCTVGLSAGNKYKNTVNISFLSLENGEFKWGGIITGIEQDFPVNDLLSINTRIDFFDTVGLFQGETGSVHNAASVMVGVTLKKVIIDFFDICIFTGYVYADMILPYAGNLTTIIGPRKYSGGGFTSDVSVKSPEIDMDFIKLNFNFGYRLMLGVNNSSYDTAYAIKSDYMQGCYLGLRISRYW